MYLRRLRIAVSPFPLRRNTAPDPVEAMLRVGLERLEAMHTDPVEAMHHLCLTYGTDTFRDAVRLLHARLPWTWRLLYRPSPPGSEYWRIRDDLNLYLCRCDRRDLYALFEGAISRYSRRRLHYKNSVLPLIRS